MHVETDGPARRRRVLLRFTVAIDNTGDGPLVVVGRRPPHSSTMRAYQVIERGDGSASTTGSVGRLRYVRAGGHEHWHLLGFAQYTLRALRGGSHVMRDSKVGFCLSDDYLTGSSAAAPSPLFLYVTCGRGHPRERVIAEGITQGYADVYPATKAGQAFDITHLRPGLYVLTVTVDPHHRLRTADASAQTVAVVVALRFHGRPSISVIRRCSTVNTCL